jgi:mono/diheme cytochrome c family protein
MKSFLFITSALFVIGCGNAHRPSPQAALAGDQVTINDTVLARGRHEFMLNCYQCHPGGAAGLAPAINDKPLPEGLIKLQIREGLGAMPAFKQEHLNDQDVDAIVRYLKFMRDQRHVTS